MRTSLRSVACSPSGIISEAEGVGLSIGSLTMSFLISVFVSR